MLYQISGISCFWVRAKSVAANCPAKMGQIAAEVGQSTAHTNILIVILISLLLLSGWIVMVTKYVHILHQISKDKLFNNVGILGYITLLATYL